MLTLFRLARRSLIYIFVTMFFKAKEKIKYLFRKKIGVNQIYDYLSKVDALTLDLTAAACYSTQRQVFTNVQGNRPTTHRGTGMRRPTPKHADRKEDK